MDTHVTVFLFVFLYSQHLKAAVLVEWDFNHGGPNTVVLAADLDTSAFFAPTQEAPGVSGSHIGVGGGFDEVAYRAGGFIRVNENNGLNDGRQDNINQAHNVHGDYFEFTITADPGLTLNLDNLTFDINRNNNGPQDYAIRTSVDSFANDFVFADGMITDSFVEQDIDFSSSSSFEGLTSITIRIVVDDRFSNNSSQSGLRIDNIVVNGEIVPEPSTSLLFCLGGLALILRPKRA